LADALAALDARYPGMRFRVVDEQGRIRPHIKMFIEKELVRSLATALPANSVLMIVGALSGG
jgi:sulfur-carrier protein